MTPSPQFPGVVLAVATLILGCDARAQHLRASQIDDSEEEITVRLSIKGKDVHAFVRCGRNRAACRRARG